MANTLKDMKLFEDRRDAGRQLAHRLTYLRGQDLVVLGVARSEVPVAVEVSQALQGPLDVVVVRKLGVPFHRGVAFGAIGEGGVRVINESVVRQAGLSADEITAAERQQRALLGRQVERLRAAADRHSLRGRIAVIVDDGIATGATAKAACQVARRQGARQIILATPIGPDDLATTLAGYADKVTCLHTPADFCAVSHSYRSFVPIHDDDVITVLHGYSPHVAHDAAIEAATHRLQRDEEVQVRIGPMSVAGHLSIPEHPKGVVVFAHGSGSSRHSLRNRYVAAVLNASGFATLLFDLLTHHEEHHRANVFDIELLASRLVEVTAWLGTRSDTASLPLGYFGASTGAAAALVAAADPRVQVRAVVSRGGRPDLAGHWLTNVTAPTLLIVGGSDEAVLELNRQARAAIPGRCELTVIPGATHLFEEPGALQQVARLACDWFTEHSSSVAAG